MEETRWQLAAAVAALVVRAPQWALAQAIPLPHAHRATTLVAREASEVAVQVHTTAVTAVPAHALRLVFAVEVLPTLVVERHQAHAALEVAAARHTVAHIPALLMAPALPAPPIAQAAQAAVTQAVAAQAVAAVASVEAVAADSPAAVAVVEAAVAVKRQSTSQGGGHYDNKECPPLFPPNRMFTIKTSPSSFIYTYPHTS